MCWLGRWSKGWARIDGCYGDYYTIEEGGNASAHILGDGRKVWANSGTYRGNRSGSCDYMICDGAPVKYHLLVPIIYWLRRLFGREV